MACGEVIEELKAARALLASQGTHIEKQGELLGLEGQISTGLRNLRTMDAAEKDQLRLAVAAAGRQVDALKSANEVLKKRQMTFLKKAKWFLFGAAAGVITGVVLSR